MVISWDGGRMRCHRTCMSQLEYSNLKLFDGPNLWLWTKNTSTFVSQGGHEYRTSPKETVALYNHDCFAFSPSFNNFPGGCIPHARLSIAPAILHLAAPQRISRCTLWPAILTPPWMSRSPGVPTIDSFQHNFYDTVQHRYHLGTFM